MHVVRGGKLPFGGPGVPSRTHTATLTAWSGGVKWEYDGRLPGGARPFQSSAGADRMCVHIARCLRSGAAAMSVPAAVRLLAAVTADEHARRRAFDYGDYVRAAVAAGSSSNGVFGAGVMLGTMEQIVTTLSFVHPDLTGADLELLIRAFGRIRFVHLQRGDTVAQAVSWTRAEQTHFWQDGETDLPGGREPRFDFQQVHTLFQTIDEHNAGWRTWFAMFEV